jgi:hypothetical protein
LFVDKEPFWFLVIGKEERQTLFGCAAGDDNRKASDVTSSVNVRRISLNQWQSASICGYKEMHLDTNNCGDIGTGPNHKQHRNHYLTAFCA